MSLKYLSVKKKETIHSTWMISQKFQNIICQNVLILEIPVKSRAQNLNCQTLVIENLSIGRIS